MSIQSSVNQMLGAAGVAANLSPSLKAKAEARAEGQETFNKAKAAYQGLQDIESNALAGKLEGYSETQLQDVQGRVQSHNKAINDLRTAELNPSSKINLEKSREAVPTGSQYSSTLKNIEDALDMELRARSMQSMMRDAAMKNMMDAVDAKNFQKSSFKQWMNSKED